MHIQRLRNIGILAHIDAGKTTVSERFLFYTGVEHRLGEVHEGTTTMDWMEEERERGITISSAVTTCPWRGHAIQLIDTPGHVDFTAEVARSLRVLDGTIVVLDGVAGPQAQTETVVRQIRQQKLPMLVFVNKMDRPGANFAEALERTQQRLHPGAVAVQIPFGEGRNFSAILDLLRMCVWRWQEEDQGKSPSQEPIPASMEPQAQAARAELCSRVAELQEAWADLYLETDDLPLEVLQQALREGTLDGTLVPVYCGAALRNLGIQPLLDGVVDYLPSPLERPLPAATNPQTGAQVELQPNPEAPAAALCFKVSHEKHGDLVYLRLFAGRLEPGVTLLNTRTGHKEKLQTLYAMHADHRQKQRQVEPGSLLAVPGLARVQTGDTLCAASRPVLLAPILFPKPVLQQAVEAMNSADHDRLEQSLAILTREDPTLQVIEDEETGGFLLAGMGELHLEIAVHRLQRAFQLPLRTGPPRVQYREGVAASGSGQGRLSVPGEEGYFVEVEVSLEPQEEETCRLVLDPACNPLSPGLLGQLQQPDFLQGWVGPEGYPLVHTRIQLRQWSASREREPASEVFVGAMQLAVNHALAANSQVLEPQMALHVDVPEAFLSGVLADLQKRHAQIQEVEAEGDQRRILAQIPLSKMAAYSTELRSLSQGMAHFQMVVEGLVPQAGEVS